MDNMIMVVTTFIDKERSIGYSYNGGAAIHFFSTEKIATAIVDESIYPAAAFRPGEREAFVSSPGVL